MSNTGWVIDWSWRTWMVGLVFGPEVWGIRLGPLYVGFDPVDRLSRVECDE